MATNDKKIINSLKLYNEDITSQVIKDLIKDNEDQSSNMYDLWDQYGGNVAILSRTLPNTNKINDKLANDFMGMIIEQGSSYVFGNPIVYSVDKAKYTDSDYVKVIDAINDFNKLNSIADLDQKSGEYAATCGYASRLLYIDTNGDVRAMNVTPWETIFVKDKTLDEIQFAMIYYQVEVCENNKTEKRHRVELYDKKNIYYFYEYEKEKYGLDISVGENPQPHMFDDVPLIKIPNNNLELGDTEKVNSLIDAYDILLSDASNESQELRLAYICFVGGVITEAELLKAKQTGAFQMPTGADIKFLTKDINVNFLKEQRDTLRKNILQFSSTVDFSDQNYAGNAESGTARKYAFQGLESKAIKKERKFKKSMNEQYKLLQFVWKKLNIIFDVKTLNMTFNRNLPIDLSYYGTISNKFFGQISEKTRLSLFPFIDDPEAELAQMRDDMSVEIFDVSGSL